MGATPWPQQEGGRWRCAVSWGAARSAAAATLRRLQQARPSIHCSSGRSASTATKRYLQLCSPALLPAHIILNLPCLPCCCPAAMQRLHRHQALPAAVPPGAAGRRPGRVPGAAGRPGGAGAGVAPGPLGRLLCLHFCEWRVYMDLGCGCVRALRRRHLPTRVAAPPPPHRCATPGRAPTAAGSSCGRATCCRLARARCPLATPPWRPASRRPATRPSSRAARCCRRTYWRRGAGGRSGVQRRGGRPSVATRSCWAACAWRSRTAAPGARGGGLVGGCVMG